VPEDILTLPAPPADAKLHYGNAPQQFGELRLPVATDAGRTGVASTPTTRLKVGPVHPVLVNIHGGFWRNKYNLTHAGHLCADLTKNGIATWNLEYRRVGDEGGGWPGTFSDIVDGFRLVSQIAPKYKLDAQRIAVMGHSAGGQLALCLAARESIQAISLAGVVNLQRAWELHLSNNAVAEFLGGPPDQVPDHYREADPMQLEVGRSKQWLVHGMEDDTVPVAFSREYYERKKSSGQVQLLEIAKADHFDMIDPRSAAWPKIKELVVSLIQ
jgi:acetyl esterase/lipase